jgi:hypothetical protein
VRLVITLDASALDINWRYAVTSSQTGERIRNVISVLNVALMVAVIALMIVGGVNLTRLLVLAAVFANLSVDVFLRRARSKTG